MTIASVSARKQKEAISRVSKTMKKITIPAAKDLPEYPPGSVMKEKLQEFGVTQEEFAAAIQLSGMQASRLLAGKKKIDVEMAFRLDRFFGIDAKDWIVMQSMYDLMTLGAEFRDNINKEVPTLLELARTKKKLERKK